jgi:hypothetical protein
MDNAAEPRNLVSVVAALRKEVLVLLIKLLLLKRLCLRRCTLLLVKPSKVSLTLERTDITECLPSLPSLHEALKTKVSTELPVLHARSIFNVKLLHAGVVRSLKAGSLNLPKLVTEVTLTLSRGEKLARTAVCTLTRRT